MATKINNWGFKLLAAWLVLQGLSQLFDLYFDGFGIISGILALVAGILIFAEK